MQNVQKKLKEEIIKDKQLYTSSSKDNSTPSDCSSYSTSPTSSSTGNSITRSSDAYIYGAGSIAVLAIC